MNKMFYLITALAFTLFINAFGQKQTIELTFTAQYQTQYVLLDSIYIENLTQGGDTMLYGPDTVLVLDYTVGVTTNPALNAGSFRVIQNRPNPFEELTTISIFLPEADHLQVSVLNLLGQKVAFFDNSLDAGNHTFVFYSGDDKYYILTAIANGLTKTIKMVSLNNYSGKYCSLSYVGAVETPDEYKSVQETNDFGYALGDQLRFIGFAKNPSDIAGSDVIEATPAGNEYYVFEIIEGIPCSGIPTVTYEGQTYSTVKIGTRCWFKENLNAGTMIPGSQEMADNSTVEKYCHNDDPVNCAVYGGLYQWDEMMQYSPTPGVQSICPEGWHVPNHDEWTVLTDFLGGVDLAGGKMKSTGTLETGTGLWIAPNLGATNSSGFTGLPSGDRSYGGAFTGFSSSAKFWTSTEFDTFYAWDRHLFYASASVTFGAYYKHYGYSIRCLLDYTTTTIPSVTTADVTGVTQFTVTCGGEVIDNGGAIVTARGVCWSTLPNPTTTDNHTSDGNGTGMFVSNITGLSANTPYFVRAYATNAIGTAYGNELSFTTLPFSTCGDVISYEGQNYNTVQIGTQCWFKENLDVGIMIEGNQNMTDNGIIEKYCYDNDPVNCATYGGLYQWYEMMQYTTQQGAQGICPAGWHIPTYAEWTVLTDFLIGEYVAGGKMKTTGTIEEETGLWYDPNIGATNSSGFSALPGGYRDEGGFYHMGYDAYFWCSTEGWSNLVWYRRLIYNTSNVWSNYDYQFFGRSGRCLQD